ncbi:DUF1330 domain-containing protein [Paracoccaceae bacterium]|jgi:uncharacterized protein (DUF1330 family)|nr:DUF1330 domain-containing protein [Paracoccaceae bacterium]|tara:strand:- start:7 stop:297 length:291 start_codon:yes stop_codon:yes gene_type:complete
MAKGYLIANIRVHDKEIFEKFKAMSTPLISEYGGKLLVRTPEVDRREGNITGLVVMLEFPNMEMAKTFYESDLYTAAKLVREGGSSTDLCLVEGID